MLIRKDVDRDVTMIGDVLSSDDNEMFEISAEMNTEWSNSN